MLSPRLALALAAGTLALLASPARAADDVPRQMTFQGRLVRADGSPETRAQDLRFALYTAPTGGAPVWEESHPGVPVTNGYYAVVLGASQPLPDSVLTGQPLHLGVALVGQSELTPRLPVVSVPYALKAGDSGKLQGLDAASFARATHSHASVPFADKAGDSDRLGGLVPADFARSGHGHATATSSASGFMSASDKARLDGMPSTYGPSLTVSGSPATVNVTFAGSGSATSAARSDHAHANATTSASGFMASADKAKLDSLFLVTAGAGLNRSGGTLSADFTPSGGNNGTATTVARGDHRHALSCTYRRTSQGGTTPAVAYCAATEVLSGGSCAEYDTGSGTVLSGGEPVGPSVTASAPQADGGPGFRCTAADSTRGIMATAMCCRVTP
jgi:hypothetical protein